MALFISFKQIVESEAALVYGAFKPEFDKLVVGTLSLPISIPGTSYHRGVQVCLENVDLIFNMELIAIKEIYNRCQYPIIKWNPQ